MKDFFVSGDYIYLKAEKLLPKLPLIIFHAVFLFILLVNFPFGKYFIGWDAVNPEFNFGLNFKRAFFPFWQEEYGLGVLGGHGFAATLPHTIITFISSLVVPTHAIRALFTLFCFYLGGLGMYFLSKLLLDEFREHVKLTSFIALFASFYYMFNLGTIQMFSVQLEAFIFQFAFLPWLFWIVVRLLKQRSKTNILLFLLINFFASGQGFIPPLFIAYIFSLGLFLFIYLISKKFSFNSIKLSGFIGALTLLINSYWLIPVTYYSFTKSNNYLSAYNNILSTADFIDKNKKYGDLPNITLVKGFLIEAYHFDQYVFESWVNHYKNFLVPVIGYLIFGIGLLGLLMLFLYRKESSTKYFLGVYLFFLTGLTTDVFPFSIITQTLQNYMPVYRQAFRIAFTKFSLGAAFSYSILFAVGFFFLISFINHLIKHKYTNKILIAIFFPLLVFYGLPLFQGNLLYRKLIVDIPNAYTNIMSFFQRQDTGRIVDLPQDCPEGWYGYNWGYFGSGFYWYGIKQPILSRVFDVWGNYNENYYWEIVQAVKNQNYKNVDKIFQKYGVDWILYDPNIINCKTPRGFLKYDELINYFNSSTNYKLEKVFASDKILPISLYKRVNINLDNFVFLAQDLPVVGPKYKWGNYDKAYEEYGDYIIEAESESENSLFRTGRFFVEGDIHKEDNDHEESSNYQKASININKQGFVHNSSSSSNLTAIIKQNIPKIPFQVNNHSFAWILVDKIFGSITRTANAAAARLVNNPESTLNQDLEKNFDTNFNLTQIYYPFRSLFTGRQQNELEFGVTANNDYFSFKTKIPKELVEYKLEIPQLDEKEITEIDKDDLSGKTLKYPQVYLDDELLDTSSFWGAAATPESDSGQARMTEGILDLPYINDGNLEVRVPKISGYYSYHYQPSTINQSLKSCDQFNKGIYTHDKISEDGRELLRLTSIGSSNCLDFDLPNLSQDLGYLVTIENRNIEGKSLLFSVINKNSQRADLETYLPKKLDAKRYTLDANKSYFIIPPMEKYGLGYTLHLDNISIGRVKTVNDLGKININPIPYRFLTALKVIKNSTYSSSELPDDGESRSSRLARTIDTEAFQVSHPNPSLYQVVIDNETMKQFNNVTMVLSQSFDGGWHAYRIQSSESRIKNYLNMIFPFWFGQEIKDHVLVNNWENGWRLNSVKREALSGKENDTIIIVYLPQYLEYFGFILLGIGILVVIFYPKSPSNHQLPTIN